jgi:uncharacterized protein (TIGR03435 family)
MLNPVRSPLNLREKLFLAAAGLVALAAPLVAGVLIPLLRSPLQAGQSSSAQVDRPSFVVVSIQPNKSGVSNLVRRKAGGLYTATNVTLNNLITVAYQLEPQQLSGLPTWRDSEHFDIEARAEGDPPREQNWLMIQSLLADRFKLVVHYETRQLPEFALVLLKAGKTGPQLKLHSDDTKCTDTSAGPPPAAPHPNTGLPPTTCGGFSGFGASGSVGIAGQKITMDMLAGLLSRQLDRVVVNRTGLSGVFDASIEFAPPPGQSGTQLGADTNASDSSGPPSIFTALQEQLGLKLESTKGPVDVLVIDHVEQPSPN